jgi:hypothetical protein
VNFQGATVNLTPTASLGLTNFIPSAVAADNAGNTYIADQANQQIYEVGPDGTWNLLALNNLPAPALGRPTGLAVDGAGDLFIADPDNNRVIWVDPSDNTAYVLASYTTGTGPTFAPRALAVGPSDGSLYCADPASNTIWNFSYPFSHFIPNYKNTGNAGGGFTVAHHFIGGVNAPAPASIAVDFFKNAYFTDANVNNNNNLDYYNFNNNTLTSNINANTDLGSVSSLALDPSGTVLYIPEHDNNCLATVALTGSSAFTFIQYTGISQLYAPAGSATGPLGVAVDSMGQIYLANSGVGQVEKIMLSSASFGHVQNGNGSGAVLLNFTFGASGTITSLALSLPAGQYLPGTSVAGLPTTILQVGTSVATGQLFSLPVTFNPEAPGLRQGDLVVATASSTSNPIPLYGISDAPVGVFNNAQATSLAAAPKIASPVQSALDGTGDLWVATAGPGGSVTEINLASRAATSVSFGPATAIPTGLAVDGQGNVFVSTQTFGQAGAIYVLPGGKGSAAQTLNVTLSGSTTLVEPAELWFDAAGNLWVADQNNVGTAAAPLYQIVKLTGLAVNNSFNCSGEIVWNLANTATPPLGLAVDASGTFYVAYNSANQGLVSVFTPEGAGYNINVPQNIPLLPAGDFFNDSSTAALGVDSFGNLYYSDPGAGQFKLAVRTPTGYPYSDPLYLTGLSTPIDFNGPISIAADPGGVLYIADDLGNQVIQVSAGSGTASFAATVATANNPVPPPPVQANAWLTNVGNLPLVITSTPVFAGTEFSLLSADLLTNPVQTGIAISNTGVAPGVPLRLNLIFSALEGGIQTDTLTVTDNNLNITGNTQDLVATGIGLDTGQPTTTTLSIPATPANGGWTTTTPVTLSAQVTVSGTTIPAGGGTVNFFDNGAATPLNPTPAPVNNLGMASFAWTPGAGNHALTASYSGVVNQWLPSSTSTTTPAPGISVSPLSTSVSVAASAASVPFGAPVTFTATLSLPAGTPGPTGNVQFFVNGQVLGSAAVDPITDTADFTTATLPPGALSITAQYLGNGVFGPSPVSQGITVDVANPASNGTNVALSLNPATSAAFGQAVTLTATVTSAGGTTSAGTVQFSDGGADLGTPVTLDANGVAAYSTSSLAAGPHTFTAVYSGNGGLTANSNSAALMVSASASGMALTATPGTTIMSGAEVTFTAAVSSAEGAPTPTGYVTFSDGSTVLGIGNLDSNGNAAFTTDDLTTLGAHTITAVYGGDGNNASVSQTLAMTVAQTAFTFTTPGGASYTLAPGGSTTFNLVLNTGSYSGPISFGTSTLPAGVTVTFAQVPPGTASPITVAVTISYNPALAATPAANASLRPIAPGGPGSRLGGAAFLACGILTLPLAGRRSRRRMGFFLTGLVLILVGGLVSCNNTGGGTGNQGQTSKVTITASAPNTAPATTTVNLTLTR